MYRVIVFKMFPFAIPDNLKIYNNLVQNLWKTFLEVLINQHKVLKVYKLVDVKIRKITNLYNQLVLTFNICKSTDI